jgi:hypothetical protein
MKNLSALVLVLLFASFSPLLAADTAPPAIAKEKIAEIEKTLRLVGVEKLMFQMKTQLFTMFREQIKEAPEEYWRRAEDKFDTKELLQLLIPLYDKYYTLEDLKTINAFYETPTGQKMLSSLPQIMAESMKIGQAYGEQMSKRLQREYEAEYKLKKQEKAAKPL